MKQVTDELYIPSPRYLFVASTLDCGRFPKKISADNLGSNEIFECLEK